MRLKSPCAPDCERRSGICHSICEEYKAYEKVRNEEYAKRYERKEAKMKTYIDAPRFKK